MPGKLHLLLSLTHEYVLSYACFILVTNMVKFNAADNKLHCVFYAGM